ncbi:MAG: SURF1 family cytochrome oxidase biogenesis protein, partial [Pseudomonadota bacterium]
VHTPLMLDNGKALIVNRGFVPFDFKDQELREQGQITGLQTIRGLVIVPAVEKPNSFVPDNAIEKREFYWRDLPAMARLMLQSETDLEFIPVFVDADDSPNPGGLPQGGATLVSFPNNHLQYAVTWYGLALTLLGVGGYFLYARRQANDG